MLVVRASVADEFVGVAKGVEENTGMVTVTLVVFEVIVVAVVIEANTIPVVTVTLVVFEGV